MRRRSRQRSRRDEGKARGVRASPGALIDLPFRRSWPPRVVVGFTRSPAGGSCRALPDHPPSPLLTPARVGHRLSQRSAPKRVASKRTASITIRRGPPDYPSPRLHRSTTARRRREAWIRRPPHRRDAGIMRPVDTSLRRGNLGGGSQGVGEKSSGIADRLLPPFRGKVGGGAARMGALSASKLAGARSPSAAPIRPSGPPSPVKGEGAGEVTPPCGSVRRRGRR
ncbi:hypothetical protein GGR12_002459 [Brevundimonas lenta]|uniref:Uncharacterized protein n=1 Tax=Brevundimonas lenta TaxID=424796 RepID=A0A7W6JGA8_9CAUL|nr:hypothetical protein [Brevundimonas lenta]